MVFLNTNELMLFLNKTVEQKLSEKDPEDIKIEIATYGLSFSDRTIENAIGELKTQESLAREFIEKLMGTNADIIVGIPPEKKYKNTHYGDTRSERRNRIDYLEEVASDYNIKIYPVEQSHLKFYRIDDVYITGGINLTDSMWNDAAVLIEKKKDKEKLDWYFQQILDRAKCGC